MTINTKTCVGMLLLSVGVASALSGTANALSPFKKAFDSTYVKPSDNDDFKKAFKKAGLLHVSCQEKEKGLAQSIRPRACQVG